MTLKKQEYIKSIGMNLVYIWEHEFTDLLKRNPLVREFYAKYLVGHPEIITSGLDKINLNDFFGIVKCKILPPRRLFLPVLPVKCNGKLTFPLCRTYTENANAAIPISKSPRAFAINFCGITVLGGTVYFPHHSAHQVRVLGGNAFSAVQGLEMGLQPPQETPPGPQSILWASDDSTIYISLDEKEKTEDVM
ncbi:hypothetical protein KUTeg_014625 [Tegillarca granosa]|uniref:Uncharacterized protein n=1 Tax=Tegillarca granosa TaxID=220873 RepID=A0ABQ9EW86_TEGGR|nr:hypothetical protein KUTeg_014625 [Tegillarca granosa]